MFCFNCCKEIPDDSEFCSGCGHKVSEQECHPNAQPDFRQKYGLPVQQNNNPDYSGITFYEKPKTSKKVGLVLGIILMMLLVGLGTFFVVSHFVNTDKPQKPFTLGIYEGNKYSNDYFGISYTLPEGFTIATNDEMEALYKIDYDIENLDNEKYMYFTYAAKHPFDNVDSFNANFQFGCEKKPMFFAPSKDAYIKSAIKLFDPEAGYIFSEPSKQTIDGVEFSVLKASVQTVSQDFYVTIKGEYYIFFIISYNSDEDKAILENIISTVDLT